MSTKTGEDHYYLSYSLCYEGDFKKAVKEVEKAIKLNANEPLYYNALGLFRESQGKDKKARKAYERCLDLDSTCWRCAVGLSAILSDDDPEKALRLMERVAADYAGVQAVQAQLSVCYSKVAYGLPTHTQAVPMFEKALEASFKALSLLQGAPDPILHYNVAATYFNLRKYDLARHHALVAQHLGHDEAPTLLKLISSKTAEKK